MAWRLLRGARLRFCASVGTVFASCRHRRAMGMIVVSVCLSIPSLPMSVPVVGSLIASQGYAFARVRRAQVKRALQWADVVHLEEPFYLQAVVAQLPTGRVCPLWRPITFTPKI